MIRTFSIVFLLLYGTGITGWSQHLPNVFGPERSDVIEARLNHQAALAFQRFPPPTSLKEWMSRKTELRDRIIEKSGVEFFPNLDLDYRETGETKIDGGVVKNIYFQTQPGIYATANLYVPDGAGPFPAVITMMGHSSNGKLYEMYRAIGHDLVRNGYVSLHIDPWGAGERSTRHGDFEYHGAHLGASLLNVGKTLLGMQVTDNIRGVDLLCSLPFVDANRIGATGASGGGNQTMWLTALDERIKAGMPVVSVGTFESYIMSSNCVCEMLPEGLTMMEESEVLGMVAPRALQVCNADKESNKAFFPSEMKRSIENARIIFGFYGAVDHLDYQIGETTHGYHPVYREYLIGWLDKHLKGVGDGSPRETIEFQMGDDDQYLVFDAGQRPGEVQNTVEYVNRKRVELSESEPGDLTAKKEQLGKVLKVPDSRIRTIHSFSAVDGWERIALETTEGYIIPILLRPPSSGSEYTIVGSTDGKDHLDPGEIKELLEGGNGICLVDFWGIGEAGSSTATRLTGSRLPKFHTLARSLIWLGTTLQGVWVNELNILVDWLREEQGAQTVNYVSDKDLALSGLFYAALHPGKIKYFELQDVPVSHAFSGKITEGFFTMSVHIPDFLKWGDVASLVALSEDTVRIINPRNLDGIVMEDNKVFEDRYQKWADKWGRSGNLKIERP